MEALAVEPLLVRDVVEGVDDEVDRDEVDPPAFEADRRHPRRQELACALDELENVVGAVDLLHLARARVADDNSGPVNAPWNLAFRAHDLLGIVLGAVVGVVEVLSLLEHVLAEHALVQPRGGDRAHVVEAAGADVVREPNDIARAVDVGDALGLLVGLEVVHGSEVEEVRDLLVLELAPLVLDDPEAGESQIPVDRNRATLVDAPVLEQLVGALRRLFPDEEVDDRSGALEELADEPLADEARGAGDEVVHGIPPRTGFLSACLSARGARRPHGRRIINLRFAWPASDERPVHPSLPSFSRSRTTIGAPAHL